MDRARKTHKFAVVPIIATSTMWTAISDVAMDENPSPVGKKIHYGFFYFLLQNILSSTKINLVDTFKVSKVKMIRALIDGRIKIIKEKL